jgi:hypothetical protein
MALQDEFNSEDEIPETLREHYKQDGEKWVLDAPGLVRKEKVNGFRDTNIRLMKENEDLQKKFSGVDLDEYHAFKSQAQKNKEKKLAEAGKDEELFNERVAPLKAEKERIEKELSSKLSAYEQELSTLKIDDKVRDFAAKLGARNTAHDDLLLRAHKVFKFEEGKVVAINGNLGKSGDPLTIGEWMGTLAESAPHLFEPSSGGGAPKVGSSSPAAAGKTINRSDTKSFLANLKEIGKGDVKVV